MSYTEKGTAKKPTIKLLKDLKWNYVKSSDVDRDGKDVPFHISSLKSSLKRLNSDAIANDEDAELVISKLRKLPNNIEGNKEFFEWIWDQKSISLKPGKKAKTIKFVDFDNLENNEFIVTEEFEFSGFKERKPDVILMINGIPVVDIEAKGLTKYRELVEEGGPMERSKNQLRTYRDEIPQLFKFFAFVCATDGFSFEYSAWAEKFFEWKEPKDAYDDDPFKTPIEQLFEKENFLDILGYFIVFSRRGGRTNKRVAWYQQLRATNKIVDRVRKGKLKKGLIWHFQGAGKTLTMLFAARKIKLEDLGNPPILLVVDRIELQNQLKDEFEPLPWTNLIKKTDELREKLSKGSREVLITTIQKFREIDITLSEREDIVVFVDEAHRSQYGKLARKLKKALPNASFFGFTGTPVNKLTKNTFRTFSPSGEDYLDRYPAKQSIEDRATKPIYYELRLPDYHIKNELNKEFFQVTENLHPAKQMEILDKCIRTRDALKADGRVKKVVEDIADHFSENVEPPGLKSMIATVDRRACVKYKESLDKYLPPEYSEIIFSSSVDDPPKLRKYHKSKKKRKNVIDNFKEEEFPKILIVSDMLLTGFNAPILGTLYLDKPLRDHNLLQAIARTNRPCKVNGFEKLGGLIVDYIGLFDEVEKALRFDSGDVEGAAYPTKILWKRFETTISNLLTMFEKVPKDDSRESLYKVLKVLSDEEKEKRFREDISELRNLYEAISHKPVLDKYEDDYKWLLEVNRAHENLTARRKDLKEYGRKTRELVDKLDVKRIDDSVPILELDEGYLQKLEDLDYFPEVQISNLRSSLSREIKVGMERIPAYKTFKKRLEEVLRIKDREELLRKLKNLASEISKIKAEASRLKLSDDEFALFSILRSSEYSDSISMDEEEMLSFIKRLLDDIREEIFEGWQQKREIRRNVRKRILDTCLGLDLGRDEAIQLERDFFEVAERNL